MVTFKDDGFIIEVNVGKNPVDAWLETHNEMIDLLQSEDKEKQEYRYHYLELLRSIMPDRNTAKKMLDK